MSWHCSGYDVGNPYSLDRVGAGTLASPRLESSGSHQGDAIIPSPTRFTRVETSEDAAQGHS